MENLIERLKQKYTLKQSIESVNGIVDPTFLRLSLGGVMDKFDSVPGEYKTDWSKLLSDVKKSKGVLSNLIKGLFGTYGGEMTFLYDVNTDEFSPKDVTMVFAGTPDKTQQTRLVKVFKESLGPQYEVVLINGDETSNREAELLAKGVVNKAKREGKKVVFISKDMGSRSFSVPEIDTVILMFDRGSFATISQKISRVLTPGKTYHGDVKTNGYVISLSLNPNRTEVDPIDEYVVYESEKVYVDELSDGIKRVLNSVNIFVDGEKLSGLELDKYCDRLINSSSLIRLGKASTNPDNIMVDEELVKIMTGIVFSKNDKCDDKLDGIDSSEVIRTKDDKKGEKTKKEVEKEEKLEKNIREKIRQQLEAIVDNIVEISMINNCESNNIIECLDMIKQKGYDSEVFMEVNMSCDYIKKVIMMGGVSVKLLNTIITSYNKEIESFVLFD